MTNKEMWERIKSGVEEPKMGVATLVMNLFTRFVESVPPPPEDYARSAMELLGHDATRQEVAFMTMSMWAFQNGFIAGITLADGRIADIIRADGGPEIQA